MNLRRGPVGLGREYRRGQSSRRKQEAAITMKLAQLELAERIGAANYGRT
jgi:hypothetical protein